ncbi:hypothetical protein C8Q77DRAFT_1161724 [Trametes polyzona]|nr:hypothetical protein C8Q77DRAFT_1161724 [Trametes polyzona]
MPAAFLSFGLYTNAFVKTLNPDLESWLTAMENVLACVPYNDSADPMNIPQQSGRQASLFFIDARLKCNRCKAVGNHECVLAAGSVCCYHCATVAKRACHWGNIHLSGEVYMRDSGALFAHYNSQGFMLLNHTRQPQEWVECFKNIEAATEYLICHAFEFHSTNLSRNLSEAERFKPTKWPPVAIAAFKARGSRFYWRTKELPTFVLPLGHEGAYPVESAPQREGSNSPMGTDDTNESRRTDARTPRNANTTPGPAYPHNATPGPANPRSSVPPPAEARSSVPPPTSPVPPPTVAILVAQMIEIQHKVVLQTEQVLLPSIPSELSGDPLVGEGRGDLAGETRGGGFATGICGPGTGGGAGEHALLDDVEPLADVHGVRGRVVAL